jgi:hypothetical protein
MEQAILKQPEVIAEWAGICPICECGTMFRSHHEWFRDQLLCASCGSIPRERAVMLVLNAERPNWRSLRIHESSPVDRGTSVKLRHECAGYVPTQYFLGVEPGTLHNNVRCENLEQQTFSDECFDVIVTQDVMEHVFQPATVYREVYRTLRSGGVYIHTTPIYKAMTESIRRAERLADGSIRHLKEPEYHGNPIDEGGALVTFHWGYDLPDMIAEWTEFDVEVRRFNDRRHGIVAEFSEVIICRKH